MIPEPMELFNQAILARLQVVEADIARLKAILGDKSLALPATGASGTMTGGESSHLAGWITPKDAPVNIRNARFVAPSTAVYKLAIGDARRVVDSETVDGYVWFKLDDGNYARGDVVTFSTEKPVSISAPATWGRWDAPIRGYTITNTHLNHRNHHGIDLSAPMGAPIVSPALGTVVTRFDCTSCHSNGDGIASLNDSAKGYGYGSFLIVRYGFKDSPRAAQDMLYMHQHVFLIFAHLQSISVVPGQDVTYGQELGRVGSTGNSSGPHLHIEARYSENLNPDWWAIRGNEIDPSILFSL